MEQIKLFQHFIENSNEYIDVIYKLQLRSNHINKQLLTIYRLYE